MAWHRQAQWPWQRPRTSAWGAVLGERDILLVALSRPGSGVVRVMGYEHRHAPDALMQAAERDHWLVQTLQAQGEHLPASARVMALALDEQRCRQGWLDWPESPDSHRLPAAVQREAAKVWGVAPQAVGFDFCLEEARPGGPSDLQTVHWAACLRTDLQQWQAHAQQAGWRLPRVEPLLQAAQRAALHLRGDAAVHSTVSARDWQFERVPQRTVAGLDMQPWLAGPWWRALAACGAALGAWS